MNMAFGDINWLAVLAAALANMLLGGFWYSPILFAKPWMAEVKLSMEQIKANSGATYRGYAIAIVASLIIATTLAALVQATGAATAMDGIRLGMMVSIGFVGMAVAANFSFEQKTSRHYLITVGYSIVGMTIMAVIITLWR